MDVERKVLCLGLMYSRFLVDVGCGFVFDEGSGDCSGFFGNFMLRVLVFFG